MDDIAHINSAFGKNPSNALTQASGRAAKASIANSVLSRHITTWNTDYFAQKRVKVFIVTGSLLDSLLGLSGQSASVGDKADLWERYNTDIKAQALSHDYAELSKLIPEARSVNSQLSQASPIKGKYYEQRIAALGSHITPLELDEVGSGLHSGWITPSSKQGLLSASERPALTRMSSSKDSTNSSTIGSSKDSKRALRQQYKVDKREMKDLDVEKHERKALKAQYKLDKANLKVMDKSTKTQMNERMARASCIWLVVLPLL